MVDRPLNWYILDESRGVTAYLKTPAPDPERKDSVKTANRPVGVGLTLCVFVFARFAAKVFFGSLVLSVFIILGIHNSRHNKNVLGFQNLSFFGV